MATKDLEHDINLIDEAAAGLRIDSSFESSPIVGKILPNSIISQVQRSACGVAPVQPVGLRLDGFLQTAQFSGH